MDPKDVPSQEDVVDEVFRKQLIPPVAPEVHAGGAPSPPTPPPPPEEDRAADPREAGPPAFPLRDHTRELQQEWEELEEEGKL